MTPSSKKTKQTSIDVARPLKAVLDAVEPKPAVSASREEKHAYASRLSRELASLMATAIRPAFPNVLPTASETGHESITWGSAGKKRTDVKVWDEDKGLLLLVSIKTYSFKDWNTKKRAANRYTKNIKRNRFELQDEAVTIHRRQPFAVMIAVIFIPITACDDGDPKRTSGAKGLSSFAHAVAVLRSQAGRSSYDDAVEKFERLYIGLYEYDDIDERGKVCFFDIMKPPPRAGRPSSTKTLDELTDEIEAVAYERHTDTIEWDVTLEDLDAESGAGPDDEDEA